MSTYIYFVLGVVTAIYLVRAIDELAKKFWKHILVPIWQVVVRPGGKIWALGRVMKG